jgi:hypothetical protein
MPSVETRPRRGHRPARARAARLCDAAEIEAILERAGDSTEDWNVRLDDVAAAPSFERWRELMRFVPAEDFLPAPPSLRYTSAWQGGKETVAGHRVGRGTDYRVGVAQTIRRLG